MSKVEAVSGPRTKTEARTKVQWPFPPLVDEGEYAKAIYRLQDEAGLGFKEARAVLMPSKFIKALAEEWGCTVENIYNLACSGREKVKRVAGDDPERMEELMPTLMRHVF